MKTLTFCLALIASSCTLASGQTYKVLYSFQGNTIGDGAQPAGRLLSDSQGNLYGTTEYGGNSTSPICFSTSGCGSIFELSPTSGGGWTEEILYSFCALTNCTDGAYPSAGLVTDNQGNLYGTSGGGDGEGDGTVFELSPPTVQGGTWTEKILWAFGGNLEADGCDPLDKLLFDAAGSLYGTTAACGAGKDAQGTAFELTPSSDGTWTETLLHTFRGTNTDSPYGFNPAAGLAFDSSGNLFGTTFAGGRLLNGVVYEMSPKSGGGWQYNVLHSFTADGPGEPWSSVTIDQTGSLYGTLSNAGSNGTGCVGHGCGGIFRTKKKSGTWVTSILPFDGTNGGNPKAGIFLASGKGFGTTEYGGAQGQGTIFAAQPSGVTVLYDFCSEASCADGSQPLAGLTYDGAGHFYGVTSLGGASNQGVVFEITP